MRPCVRQLAALVLLPAVCLIDGETESTNTITATKCRGDSCEIKESLGSFLTSGSIDVQTLTGGHKRKFKKLSTKKRDVDTLMDGRHSTAPDKIWYGEDGNSTLSLIELQSGGDDEKLVFGSITDTDEDAVYHIAPGKDNKPILIRKESKNFPLEKEPRHDRRGLRSETKTLNTHSRDLVSQDDGSIIDVMVVWTKRAECMYYTNSKSALCVTSDKSKKKMMGLIELAVQETNVAYEFSGIETKLSLVHAYQDANYVETSKDAFDYALDDITGRNDGHMDDVHALREKYGADVVVFLIHDDAYCGIAWLGPAIDKMFSVTAWNCATGYYSFGHEIGHNMGCNHDRGTSGTCSSKSSNSYGFRDPDAGFRSIMSYNCISGQCDRNRGGGCTRVNRFSNTQYLYNGLPIGSSLHNNAARINSMRRTVAAYFPSKDIEVCTNNAFCDDGDSCTTNTCGVNGKCQWSLKCPTGKDKTLGTTMKADTGNAGNMFDIKAKKLLAIRGVQIHTKATSTVKVEVYTREGTYVSGSEKGWELVQKVSLHGKGTDSYTKLPEFSRPVAVRANMIQSFYVTLTSKDLRYSKGTKEGNLVSENDDIIIYEGVGVSFPFGSTFPTRVFNGRIIYGVASQVEGEAPEVLLVGQQGQNGCENDKRWYKMSKKGRKRGCDWVAQKSKRCKKVGRWRMPALDACPLACKRQLCDALQE